MKGSMGLNFVTRGFHCQEAVSVLPSSRLLALIKRNLREGVSKGVLGGEPLLRRFRSVADALADCLSPPRK